MGWFVKQHQIIGTVSKGAVRARGMAGYSTVGCRTAHGVKEKLMSRPPKGHSIDQVTGRGDSHFQALISVAFFLESSTQESSSQEEESCYPSMCQWHSEPAGQQVS